MLQFLQFLQNCKRIAICIIITLTFLNLSAFWLINLYEYLMGHNRVFVFNNSVSATMDLVGHIVPQTSDEVQTNAVRALFERSLGVDVFAENFIVNVDSSLEFRTYQICKISGQKISIHGSDGISVAKGFHHILKYYIKRDITWTNTSVQLPPDFMSLIPDGNITSTSESSFIYYQNVCTWGYSFVWWDWSTWRRHIDWMAMQGISLTIAPIQEEIWYQIYVELGLTEQEIDDYFAGPAFQPWQRMGNLQGWGGPLPATYRRAQFLLQRQILNAQRELGIAVALPAFTGHVPRAMQRVYPNVKFSTGKLRSHWDSFPNKFCCVLFVDQNAPLFQEIGSRFLRETIQSYGTNHIYFCDPFNEMKPSTEDTKYLHATAAHIYESMHTVDPRAIWLLQGWMFYNDKFWEKTSLIEAFVTAVPRGRMVVLDMISELAPQYERTHSFFGQPFIWCMLHNFGGTLGMHGSADKVNKGIGKARKQPGSTLAGVGITPEGIFQNYAMYVLALERAWVHDDFNLDEWFATFATVRYGVEDERLKRAWQLLQQSVYSYVGREHNHGLYIIVQQPTLKMVPWSIMPWYNESYVLHSWELLLAANAAIPDTHRHNYAYDLVDVTRQFLQETMDHIYVNMISAYGKQQKSRFNSLADKVLILLDDMEALLASHKNFLLGRWLASARRQGKDEAEKRLFEMNARNQITAWGPNGEVIDYATKQWSGIVQDYYKPRWNFFVKVLRQNLKQNTRFNRTVFQEIVAREIEKPFSVQTTVYPTEPKGDSFQIASLIHEYWRPLLEELLHALPVESTLLNK